MGTILIVAEIQGGKIREASFELASVAQKLAAAGGHQVKSLVAGKGIAALAEEFAKKGGGDVYAADHEALANYCVETASRAIRAAVDAERRGPGPALEHAERLGRCAPHRRGSRRGLRERLLQDRSRGRQARLPAPRLQRQARRAHHREQPAGGRDRPARGDLALRRHHLGKGHAARVEFPAGARARFVAVKIAESKGVDLSKADIIVSGGRGVGAPEKFPEVIQPLADALGGAMGASRPVVDAGWLPHHYQVGSSGQVVQPKLYIAAGISGAIQHLVGMKTSNYIIAINKDPDAPIFEVANLGVVGDLFEIVPALTKAVLAAKG